MAYKRRVPKHYKKDKPTLTQPSDQTIKYIPLTKGKVAIVDSDDYARLIQFNWCYGVAYALRSINNKNFFMHHAIIGLPTAGMVVDHINKNPLDNRKANLRFATIQQNYYNTDYNHKLKQKDHSIYFCPGRKFPWRVDISHEGKRYPGGYFATHTEALAKRNTILKNIK